MKLLRRIQADLDWWYEEMKRFVTSGHRDFDPQAKIIMKLLDKLLIEQRGGDPALALGARGYGPRTGAHIEVHVHGVQRGTAEARAAAEEIREAEFTEMTVATPAAADG